MNIRYSAVWAVSWTNYGTLGYTNKRVAISDIRKIGLGNTPSGSSCRVSVYDHRNCKQVYYAVIHN